MTELLPKYLQREMYGVFRLAWKRAEEDTKRMNPKKDNLTTMHAIALRIYSNDDPNIHERLNKEVRGKKEKYKSVDGFRFHSLHFLLTDAIQRLNRLNNDCVVTYRGTKDTYTPPKGEVRFGFFTSTSTNKTVPLTFGNKTCFVVKTCHGAPISKYSKFPDEQEVLIPPYEQFKVIKRNANPKIKPKNEINCDVVYHLESNGILSNLRCALFGKEGEREWYNSHVPY
ncbi:NAD(P)(+)--arginine ADP-ribosyltransferase 2-like [Engraulis encrasicolus]|uniref:NAD(P)(+)--arginine ADP-ribosyltransferase 2-like n=1 Tax=Engraulis encrasicolus TaxID=184585 RepID=UPI002FD7053C